MRFAYVRNAVKMRFVVVVLVLFFGILMEKPAAAQYSDFSNRSIFNIELELSQASPEELRSFELISNSITWKQALKRKGIKVLALGLHELEERKENTRLVAALLTLTLGPFGAHRLYLGTEAMVPVFYTLTLGGGLGILPVIDLFHILLVKDLSGFYNNPGVFMWGGADEKK